MTDAVGLMLSASYNTMPGYKLRVFVFLHNMPIPAIGPRQQLQASRVLHRQYVYYTESVHKYGSVIACMVLRSLWLVQAV